MKKIAVMLPHSYRGGTLRGAKIIAKSLVLAARSANDDTQVIFSYVSSPEYIPDIDFSDLHEMGISLRPTEWVIFDLAKKGQYKEGYLASQTIRPLTHNEYCLPKDGLNDFFDCDLWIIISDRLPAPIYPVKKYICITYDYIQRYVPDIFGDSFVWGMQEAGFLPVAREAERVFVTTPSTQEDAIAYAGVARERIQLLPMNFEPLEAPVSPDNSPPYLLWATNSAHHKNHINSFKALEIYYGSFDGKLDVLVTGENVSVFDPASSLPTSYDLAHIRASRKLIAANPDLSRHIQFRRFSDAEYAGALSKAKFLWHTAIYDNGAYAALEAAYLGVPTLSSRYPAMEYMDRTFALNLSYFDPKDVQSMAEGLHFMEQQYTQAILPSKESMRTYGWKANASVLYQAVLELL